MMIRSDHDVTVPFRIGKVSRVTWPHVTALVQNRHSLAHAAQGMISMSTAQAAQGMSILSTQISLVYKRDDSSIAP
jgi:hypothetical protein